MRPFTHAQHTLSITAIAAQLAQRPVVMKISQALSFSLSLFHSICLCCTLCDSLHAHSRGFSYRTHAPLWLARLQCDRCAMITVLCWNIAPLADVYPCGWGAQPDTFCRVQEVLMDYTGGCVLMSSRNKRTRALGVHFTCASSTHTLKPVYLTGPDRTVSQVDATVKWKWCDDRTRENTNAIAGAEEADHNSVFF